jgi:hypothetical protein
MSSQYAISATKRQEAQEKSQAVTQLLEEYLKPLVEPLDAYLDKRLVRTFLQGIQTLIEARTQAPGGVISALGSVLLSGREATAGEKRFHRHLRLEKWNEDLIKSFQWKEGEKRYEELRRKEEEIYVIWDGSMREKPESQKAEDLCAVKSSKAARRKKSRKGSFNQPGGKPIGVLGYEWTACVMTGKGGKTSAGADGEVPGGFPDQVEERASFVDEQGEEKSLGQRGKTKRSWGYRKIWDAGMGMLLCLLPTLESGNGFSL